MKLFNRVSRRIRSQSRKRPPVRLSFDLFEERLLLATFTVNSNADTITGQATTAPSATSSTNWTRRPGPQHDRLRHSRPWGANDQPGPPCRRSPSRWIINGYTQPGARQNSLATGDNAVPAHRAKQGQRLRGHLG